MIKGKNETVTFTGKAYWMKVFEENRDLDGYEGSYRDHDGACTIQIELDEASEQRLKETGSKLRTNKDGHYKFKRKFKDKSWAGGAPKVTNLDGSERKYEDGPIGNGSDVVVDVEFYKTKMGVGHRLESIRILNEAPMPDLEEA